MPRIPTKLPKPTTTASPFFEAMSRDDFVGAMEAYEHMPPDKRRALVQANRARLMRMARQAQERVDKLTYQVDSLNDVLTWADRAQCKMERPTESAWPRIVLAHDKGRIEYYDRQHFAEQHFFHEPPQVVIVEHDWSSAFANATDFSTGEYHPPFPLTAFEFQVSGRRCVIVANDAIDESCMLFEALGGWHYVGPPFRAMSEHTAASQNAHDVFAFLNRNVRAACIALDANVAALTATRIAHRANTHRLPGADLMPESLHTISLVRAARCARPLEALGGSHRSPRLHFRRGHWRHYDNHKTWIRWTLVGDPDLGFIDKEYRL